MPRLTSQQDKQWQNNKQTNKQFQGMKHLRIVIQLAKKFHQPLPHPHPTAHHQSLSPARWIHSIFTHGTHLRAFLTLPPTPRAHIYIYQVVCTGIHCTHFSFLCITSRLPLNYHLLLDYIILINYYYIN